MTHTELSRQQLVFWDMARGGDDGPVNQSDVLLLRGALDVEALQKSFDTLVLRQEALRSRVVLVDGMPMQTVDEHALIPIDIQDFSTEDRRPHLKSAIEQCLFRAFDLLRDFPLRLALFKLADREHVLAIVSHHIINDDRSAVILAQEISTLYNAYTNARPLLMAELPAQYIDYARQQNEYLRSEAAQRQLEFWRRQLAEIPPLFPPLTQQGPLPLFSMHLLLVPREVVSSLQQVARSHGVSLFMLLLVAYKIALAKWTGSRDVMVSMLLDGRRHIQFKNVIGCFASMQWVRTTLGAQMDIANTIQNVRRSFWQAYGTQSALVEWQRALSSGRTGPGKGFEVSINFHNSQQWHWRLDGITATRYTEYSRPPLRLDWDLLWFDLDHQPEGIQTLILYGDHRFSAARIQSFADDYLALLQEIARQ